MSTLPRTLGRYEVVAAIGRGTMGSLYRARDPRIGRQVAVKLLQEGFDTPELRSRFAREARAAGSLSHPNIVTVYDIGEHEGRPFIAMEYVPGETFAELIASRTPLLRTRKLQMIEEVCAGLAHAHESGIVHRDIKPANLMIGPEGTVKILDFGIARLNTSGMTQPGVMMGTLNYMSPEQINGEPVDARSDIFAVGAVLYELLSLQQAFPGAVHQAQTVLRHILSGDPEPLSKHCPDIDPRLVRVVNQALQKKREHRFQTADQMRNELAAIRLGSAPEPLPAVADNSWTRDPTIVMTPSSDRTMSYRGARPRIDPATLARQRAQQIEDHLKAAESSCGIGDYDAAIESCEQVFRLDPSEPRATALLDRIQAAVNERQVQASLSEARQNLARGAIGTAAELVESASVLSPHHPDIAAVVAAIEREKARVRSDASLAASERARAALGAGDLTMAQTFISQAAALDPDGADVQALKAAIQSAVAAREEEARVRTAVSQARRQFISGDHAGALQLLETESESNPLVATALEEFRSAVRAMEERRRAEQERLERQQRVEALFADARRAIEQEQFEDALAALDLARETDESAPRLAELGERIREAQAAARRREELTKTLAAIGERLDAEDLAAVEPLLVEATRLGPADDRVREARGRFDRATTERAAREAAEAAERAAREAAEAAERTAREAAEARTRESDEQVSHAAELVAKGDLAAAEQRLHSAAELNPDNPRLSVVAAQLKEELDKRAAGEATERRRQQIVELVRAASQPLQATDPAPDELVRAVAKLDEALAIDPDNTDALELKPALDKALAASREQARIRAEVNNARRRFANGKHFAALQLLESIRPASHPLVVEALEELRGKLRHIEDQQRADQAQLEREQRVAQLMAEAKSALAAQQFGAAVEALTQARELDSTAEGLSALLAQASAARAAQAARALESERRTAEAAARLQQGDLSAAQQLIEKAVALDPQNASAATLTVRIKDAINVREAADAAEREQRRRELDELFTSASKCLETGDHAGARERLQSLQQKEPGDPRIARLKRQIDAAIKKAEDAARRQRRVEPAAAPPAVADVDRTVFVVPKPPTAHAGGTPDLLIGRENAVAGEVARAAAPDTLRIPEPWVSAARSKSPGMALRDNPRLLLIGAAAAAVVLLVILVLVFRRSPSDAAATPGAGGAAATPATSVAAPEPVTPEPAPEPATPKTFDVTITGRYKFAVEFPGGKRPAATRQTLTLPAGQATAVRLTSPGVFLNQVVSVRGDANETKNLQAPAMSSVTVYNSFNESCEIFIDGRMVGYHPWTQELVAGPHQISLKCASGQAPVPKSVQVGARSETIAFTKNDKIE